MDFVTTNIEMIVLVCGILIVASVSITAVPQQNVFLVHRMGRYRRTLGAGFHLVIPFVESIGYRLSLKEQVCEIQPQHCITTDNISVTTDGILYYLIQEPTLAAYGIEDYTLGITQLAQSTVRTEIGKLDLDHTFSERETISGRVAAAVNNASEKAWGITVARYEIRDITVPGSIKEAMEKKMRADREKLAAIALSEGEREANINRAEGAKLADIMRSEGERQRRINEAEGQAQEILNVAEATASGISQVALTLREEGGVEAVNLRIAEHYLDEFGKLARTNNVTIIPSDLSDVAGMVAAVGKVIQSQSAGPVAVSGRDQSV